MVNANNSNKGHSIHTYKVSEKKALVDEFLLRTCGGSARTFAKSKGIAHSTFSGWVRDHKNGEYDKLRSKPALEDEGVRSDEQLLAEQDDEDQMSLGSNSSTHEPTVDEISAAFAVLERVSCGDGFASSVRKLQATWKTTSKAAPKQSGQEQSTNDTIS